MIFLLLTEDHFGQKFSGNLKNKETHQCCKAGLVLGLFKKEHDIASSASEKISKAVKFITRKKAIQDSPACVIN